MQDAFQQLFEIKYSDKKNSKITRSGILKNYAKYSFTIFVSAVYIWDG